MFSSPNLIQTENLCTQAILEACSTTRPPRWHWGAMAAFTSRDRRCRSTSTTKGVYQPSFAFSTFGSNFLTKLNPDGSLAWSTYFSDGNTSISAIAVDPAGNVFIGGVSG